MSGVEIALAILLLGVVGYLVFGELRRRRTETVITPAATRILFPFVGNKLSTPAFDAALRIARAEGATLVPAYLAIVPLSVQLDTPLKRQAQTALPMLEAIEQRAAAQGVPVDSRIEPGRSGDGFNSEDVAWMLENVPGEILILRPSREPAKLAGRARDKRRDHSVRRVFLRMPEHAKDKAPVP